MNPNLLLFLFCGFGKAYAENLRFVSCTDELGIEKVLRPRHLEAIGNVSEANYDVGGEN